MSPLILVPIALAVHVAAARAAVITTNATIAAGGTINCWPAEFAGNGLAFPAKLMPLDWTVLPGASNRCVGTPMAPENSFRLWKP